MGAIRATRNRPRRQVNGSSARPLQYPLRQLVAHHVALHHELGLEARDITVDRRDRQRALATAIAHQAIARGDIAFDLDVVPGRGVADIVDRHIVVLAPEERGLPEPLVDAQHVAGGELTVALGDDPMLDADAVRRISAGPAPDVAGGVKERAAALAI